MSIENVSGSIKVEDQSVKDFLKEIRNVFKKNVIVPNYEENIRNNKKKLQKLLKEKFEINYIKSDGINKLYTQIFENLQYIKFYKKEDILDFDISNIKKEILQLKRNSNRLEKHYENKIGETVLNIQNHIFDYLEDNLSDDEKQNIFKKIKPYTGEISKLEDVEIGQTLVQTMGKNHILLTLVIEVNGKKLNVDILKNKKTGKIIENFVTKATEDLHGGNKKSGIKRKLYDNPNAGFILNPYYKVNYNKFNLENNEKQEYTKLEGSKSIKIIFPKKLREEIKKGEKNIELNEFVQITKEWNKIFKKNKEELLKAKTEKEKQEIIDKNAQAIANLFADNASLQGTMDFDNSHGVEGVKGYFLHFLQSLPTMKFSKINEIKLVEEDLLFVQGDYLFEVDNGKGGRIVKDANFAFYFEKNYKTGKWGIKRLKSTFGKTEDNLKEV